MFYLPSIDLPEIVVSMGVSLYWAARKVVRVKGRPAKEAHAYAPICIHMPS